MLYLKGGKVTLEMTLLCDIPSEYYARYDSLQKFIKYEPPKYEPKIGDKVTWGTGFSILTIIATHDNDMVWMLSEAGAYQSHSIKSLKDFRLAPDV